MVVYEENLSFYDYNFCTRMKSQSSPMVVEEVKTPLK